MFGLARSGITAAEALRAGGAKLACWDDGEQQRAAASAAGLPLVDLDAADWRQFAALVLAPGVPLTHPKPHWTVEKARATGVEVIGDVELFFRERAATAPGSTVVAITGTNGKSTTTALVAHVLRSAGRRVAMGGNIGVGVLSLEPPSPDVVHVLELSSFQVDLTPSLAPTIGILTNITPDHLDRHGTIENYSAVKERLLRDAEVGVVGMGDEACRAIAGRRLAQQKRTIGCLVADDATRAAIAPSSAEIAALLDAGLELLVARSSSGVVRHESGAADGPAVSVADLAAVPALRGPHNAENAAFAVAVALELGLGNGQIAAALGSFPGLQHRMEVLGRIGKVTVVNDSKATNADSVEKALASFDGGIFWIAGGIAKDGGIESLARYFPRLAKAYLIGESAGDFAETLAGKAEFVHAATLPKAIEAAIEDALTSKYESPVVLLSPACASFDQYKSFEHRGEHFRALFEVRHRAESSREVLS